MQTDTRLPVYAHWRGQEFNVDLPENQPTPDVGSIIHLTVDVDGAPRRLPFIITSKRQRTDPEHESGLLARIGFDGGALPTGVDVAVVPHDPEH